MNILIILFILVLINVLVALAYYSYTQYKLIQDLKCIRPTTFVIGKPDIFTADDEKILSTYKDWLQLLIKKIDTRLATLYDSLRIPSDNTEFKQGKVNMLIDLRNDLFSLYNRKDEE